MRQSLSILTMLILAHGSVFVSAGTVPQASDLSVRHTVFPSPNVLVASGVIYTVTVTNTGPDAAESVVVSNALDPAVDFFSCSSTSAGRCGNSGSDITVSFASLGPGGQAVISIIGVVGCSVGTGTLLTNTVTVSSASSDSNPNNNISMTTVRAFNQPPLIGCSEDLSVVVPGGQSSAVVNYPPPEFFDKCPGTTVVCSPPSGSAFALGSTLVFCAATDSAGATSNCGFTVMVKHAGPHIIAASVSGKRLLITGEGFDLGAVILMNGNEQKTLNNDEHPAASLIGKKAGKKISPGETVILQVRNADGRLSDEFSFTRPID